MVVLVNKAEVYRTAGVLPHLHLKFWERGAALGLENGSTNCGWWRAQGRTGSQPWSSVSLCLSQILIKDLEVVLLEIKWVMNEGRENTPTYLAEQPVQIY